MATGGFAHVYLVRTPTPVYNTTHHVLKRIAVANEAMLSEVKKEVDVMVCQHTNFGRETWLTTTLRGFCEVTLTLFTSSMQHGTAYRTGLMKSSS